KGRVRVPPKHSTEWEGMSSPDLWDAICFGFLEGVNYNPVSGAREAERDLGASVEAEIDDLFAAV
ncbi:MAG: hypothetical protein ACRCT2_12770, partial [Plesiomonas shigelloides]